MNYSLSKPKEDYQEKVSWTAFLKKMGPLLAGEQVKLVIVLITLLLNSALTLVGPLVIGHTINTFIAEGDFHGVLMYSLLLIVLYIGAFISNYIQMKVMGAVAQRTLFRLRNTIFGKLMELPLVFFNQNKSGDLISRLNNDTDKLNQFFSEGLMRFAGTFFLISGAAVFVIAINWKLALAALTPAILAFIFTRFISPWVKKRTSASLKATGSLSSEVQETMSNFKVILAFNRRDYFRERFAQVNEHNFKMAFWARIANEIFTPVFEWSANIALLIVLSYGIYLIDAGAFTVGFLVSFVMYITRFYDPLREIARLWSTFQTALAAWDRIGEILHLKSNLEVITDYTTTEKEGVIQFKNVSFGYPEGETVLTNANLLFEKGKTYALVGPTGGGKTTSASLIARLYDPTEGTVYLDGKDIRAYESEERAEKIGFILQEPFLFSGTVGDNILYGNAKYIGKDKKILENDLRDAGLLPLLERFDKGLDTPVGLESNLSLGQRQLIAFIRAVLRKPEILILDEATANIDTVTEKILDDVLKKLPKETTRVIIAHRLNTIENADGIFFVNGGEIVEAGSMDHAVEMLLHHKRKS